MYLPRVSSDRWYASPTGTREQLVRSRTLMTEGQLVGIVSTWPARILSPLILFARLRLARLTS